MPLKMKTTYSREKWLYLLLALIVCAVVALCLTAAISFIASPKDRYVEIGANQYLLSKETQKYLKIYDSSDYEKDKSVLIIEEPHFNVEGQINLYKGLEEFFSDNPELLDKTIFLAEGVTSNVSVSVEPLISVDADPADAMIFDVLESFLVPGYMAYEWAYQEGVSIAGIENEKLYRLSARIWVDSQEDPGNMQTIGIWNKTVFARNESISNILYEKTKSFENPILFIGGLHIRTQNTQDVTPADYDSSSGLLSAEEASELDKCSNLGIYDYLREKKIGYTFLVSVNSGNTTVQEMDANLSRYVDLFKAQQTGDSGNYTEKNGADGSLDNRVTVAPSPIAAAHFLDSRIKNGGTDNSSSPSLKESNSGGFWNNFRNWLGNLFKGGKKGPSSAVVPQKAYDVADFVLKKNGAPPPGHKGRREFKNDGRYGSAILPRDTNYREYDVNPHDKGQKRDDERLVIGDNGSAWYTDNHYSSFTKIK